MIIALIGPKGSGKSTLAKWKYGEQAGNLGPGWRQFRKMLPNESVAPLPESYR